MNSNSFFSQIKQFCVSLENEISSCNTTFQKIPGKYPKKYYKGLEALQGEIQIIKALDAEINKSISNFHKFDYFVKSVQELIDEQEADVGAMELYLQRFGYRIPERALLSKKETEHQSSGKEIDEPEDNKSTDGIPDLPDVDNVIKEPRLDEQLHATSTLKGRSPVISRAISPEIISTPSDPSIERVEQWLRHSNAVGQLECNESGDEFKENAFAEDSRNEFKGKQRKAMSTHGKVRCAPRTISNCVPDIICTPEEPDINQYQDPPVPDMYECSPDYISAIHRDLEQKVCTPDDPVLTFETNKNVVLGSHSPSPRTRLLSQENYQRLCTPTLSEITQNVLNVKPFQRPSESTLLPPRAAVIDEPKTPELSDVTLKIIHKNISMK